MPSGPKIPDDLRNWITHKAQEHPDWRPAVIHAEMVSWLGATRPDYAVPKIDAIRKVATNARKKSQLDDPWSLGASELFNIPHNATADLIALLRYALIGGTKFTIRQAIWAARLTQVISATPTSSRLEELHDWAGTYAAAQRVMEALAIPLDTSYLDSKLALRDTDSQDARRIATKTG